MQQEWELSLRETLLPTQFVCFTSLKHFAEDGQIQIPGSHPGSKSANYPTVGSISLSCHKTSCQIMSTIAKFNGTYKINLYQ
jgi:hypothetical protein